MAQIRIAGFGGPGDPYIITYNASEQSTIQELVDEINASAPMDENGPIKAPFIIDTYIETRISEMIQSWIDSRVTVRAKEVADAYRDADNTTKASVISILGL